MTTKPRDRHLLPIKSLGNSKYASGVQTEAFLGLMNGSLTRGFFLGNMTLDCVSFDMLVSEDGLVDDDGDSSLLAVLNAEFERKISRVSIDSHDRFTHHQVSRV